MLLGHIFLRRCVSSGMPFTKICLSLNISNLFWRSVFNKDIGIEEIAGSHQVFKVNKCFL